MEDFLAMDEQGFLLNTSSEQKIVSPWDVVVREIKLACLTNLGGKLRSIYVAGSVSHGTAVMGTSDIDLYVVVDTPLAEINTTWWNILARELRSRYPFIPKIDLLFVPYQDFLSPHRLSMAKFVIKTQAACVFGEDIAQFITPYQPGERTLFQVYLIKKHIAKAKTALEHSSSVEHTQGWCTWIMKRILRVGFELVLERERKYPFTLSACYLTFARYYPAQAHEMKHALEYATNPPTDPVPVLSFLNKFGPWIVEQSNAFVKRKTARVS
ncbi:nucleotidyltransferase domain-containing protein [Candidatus Woesearchaeota archaeon]|nr:nucleotidyltransferase domain-containing protein [Candidatus Woesearchaeota archaeon]